MKFLIAIVVIAVIAVIGSRVTFLNRRLPIGFRNILFTGTEYIFIGLLLGSSGLNVLDRETLIKLDSILLVGLAWIGFLYGLQFEIRLLRTLPRHYFTITAIQSTVTFILVGSILFLFFLSFLDFSPLLLLLSALTLGATASCSAQSSIAIVNRNYQIGNRGLLDLMRYISSVDGLFALLFFGISLSIIPMGGTGTFNLLCSLRWLAISVLLGLIPALILILLSKTRFSQQEYSLFLVGTLLFCGGLAHQLHFSPLISGLICGVITANFCRHRLRALQITVQGEKSIYILLLLLIGASWRVQFDIGLVIGAGYFLLRLAGKLAGVYAATRLFKPIYDVPRRLGLGLISEGGLVIAILLNFKFFYPDVSNSLITAVVLSVILSEFLAPSFILMQFREGELEERRESERLS